MFPTMPINDVSDLRRSHVVNPSQRDGIDSECVIAANGDHIGFSQFRIMVLLALASGWNHATAFLSHVSQIVLLRADEQMVWSHAERRVAVMANAHTWWNGTVSQFPSHSVRQNSVTFAAVGSDASPVADASSPQPAGFRFVDLAPKLGSLTVWRDLRHDHSPRLTQRTLP